MICLHASVETNVRMHGRRTGKTIRPGRQRHHQDTFSTCVGTHLPTNKGWNTEWAPSGIHCPYSSSRLFTLPKTITPSICLNFTAPARIHQQNQAVIKLIIATYDILYNFTITLHHITSYYITLHYTTLHHPISDQIGIR